MLRLIDADKVIQCDVFGGLSDFAQDCRNAVIELLSIQPTINAVPVVRCRECKEYKLKSGSWWCVLHMVRMHDDDFCSYGERNEELK